MSYSYLKTLQQQAIESVSERVKESSTINMQTRAECFSDLHIAAFMDVKKTTGSLQQVLEYKKEVAVRMLTCSNEKQMETLAEALKHSEELIKKVLGICI